MEKLSDLRRIMYENYNNDELIEYYQRKVIMLKNLGASENIISAYLYKIEQLNKQKKESSRQK